MSFQHVRQKVERLPGGGIQIINPNFIQNLLIENELTNCNTKSTPYVTNDDLLERRPDEEKADVKYFQKSVGTLRFIADTKYLGILWTVGVLERNLHNPATHHVAALK